MNHFKSNTEKSSCELNSQLLEQKLSYYLYFLILMKFSKFYPLFYKYLFELTKWRSVWPKTRVCAPDDGLTNKDVAFITSILHRMTDQIFVARQDLPVMWRQRRWTFNSWRKEVGWERHSTIRWVSKFLTFTFWNSSGPISSGATRDALLANQFVTKWAQKFGFTLVAVVKG